MPNALNDIVLEGIKTHEKRELDEERECEDELLDEDEKKILKHLIIGPDSLASIMNLRRFLCTRYFYFETYVLPEGIFKVENEASLTEAFRTSMRLYKWNTNSVSKLREIDDDELGNTFFDTYVIPDVKNGGTDLRENLRAFREEHAKGITPRGNVFFDQLAYEMNLYLKISTDIKSRTPTRTPYEHWKLLLPVWIAKKTNPLFNSLCWTDQDLVDGLIDKLSDHFRRSGAIEDVVNQFDVITKDNASSYVGLLNQEDAYETNATFEELYTSFTERYDGNAIGRGDPIYSRGFSARGFQGASWIKWKTFLIHNLIACPAKGGGIGASYCESIAAHTELAERGGIIGESYLESRLLAGTGDAVLLQAKSDNDIQAAKMTFIIKISLGSDPDDPPLDEYVFCRKPHEDQSDGTHFISTGSEDVSENHLRIHFSGPELVAEDCGQTSLNGTYIERIISSNKKNDGSFEGTTQYYVLEGRDQDRSFGPLRQALLDRSVPSERIRSLELHESLPLHRGDLIHLPGLTFQIC